MANGWRDLSKELERQIAANARDPAALWSAFETLAAASPRAQVLGLVRKLGTTLSPEQRTILAVAVGELLDPIEWPEEWEQARQPLVKALDELSHQADPRASDSLPAVLRLEDDPLFLISHAVLTIARDFLRKPCPRDQLATAAALCRSGSAGWFFAFKQKLQNLPPDVDRSAVQIARTRIEVAFQKYAHAARAMNAACGAVLFDGLDMRLEGS